MPVAKDLSVLLNTNALCLHTEYKKFLMKP